MATLSAYTTAFEAITREYPLRECLTQLASFCDEVVVVDAGSTDGTWDMLGVLARELPQLRIERRAVGFDDPRWALALDGGLKAEARALCSGEFCWQADLDEIPADDAGPMLRALIDEASRVWPDEWHLVAPVFVEYWGSLERARIDVPACFPRLSHNHRDITHGVSRPWRRFDARGRLCAALHKSDSCEYVHRVSYEALPLVSLLPPELDQLRQRAAFAPTGRGDEPAAEELDAALARSRYQVAFNEVIERTATVFHLSWLDIERKLRHYREHWPAFHASLFDAAAERSTPSLFDKPWCDVGDAELECKAAEVAKEGPRVLHGESPGIGQCIRIGKAPPRCAHAWIEARIREETTA